MSCDMYFFVCQTFFFCLREDHTGVGSMTRGYRVLPPRLTKIVSRRASSELYLPFVCLCYGGVESMSRMCCSNDESRSVTGHP